MTSPVPAVKPLLPICQFVNSFDELTILLPPVFCAADCAQRSQAVGEPPLLLAYSVFGATRAAITASRLERGKSGFCSLDVPATVDRVRAAADVSTDELIDAADTASAGGASTAVPALVGLG